MPPFARARFVACVIFPCRICETIDDVRSGQTLVAIVRLYRAADHFSRFLINTECPYFVARISISYRNHRLSPVALFFVGNSRAFLWAFPCNLFCLLSFAGICPPKCPQLFFVGNLAEPSDLPTIVLVGKLSAFTSSDPWTVPVSASPP